MKIMRASRKKEGTKGERRKGFLSILVHPSGATCFVYVCVSECLLLCVSSHITTNNNTKNR
jgi:hypothetical protein